MDYIDLILSYLYHAWYLHFGWTNQHSIKSMDYWNIPEYYGVTKGMINESAQNGNDKNSRSASLKLKDILSHDKGFDIWNTIQIITRLHITSMVINIYIYMAIYSVK